MRDVLLGEDNGAGGGRTPRAECHGTLRRGSGSERIVEPGKGQGLETLNWRGPKKGAGHRATMTCKGRTPSPEQVTEMTL